MTTKHTPSYPSILGAAHLIVLYIFIQAIIDFPFALWDYFYGTSYLSHPIKRVALSIVSISVILFYAYKRAKVPIRDLFPLKKFNPLILLPLTLLLIAQQIYIAPINESLTNVITPPSWFWELFDNIFENKYGFWGILLRVAVIAPIVEESIFRGVIMHGLMRNYPKLVAIFFSGLFFALFHLNPWQFSATFCLGCILGWIMIITQNIMACVLGHAINNLIVLLSMKYDAEIQQWYFFTLTENQQLYIGITLALIGLLFLGFFAYRYRTKSLDYKEFKLK